MFTIIGLAVQVVSTRAAVEIEPTSVIGVDDVSAFSLTIKPVIEFDRAALF